MRLVHILSIFVSAESNLCLLQTFLESREPRMDAKGGSGLTADDAELLSDMEVEAMARRSLPLIDMRGSARISRTRGTKRLEAPRVLVIGTHHKSGTDLMKKLMDSLRAALKHVGEPVLYHRELNSEATFQFSIPEDTEALQGKGWANNKGIQIFQYQNIIPADFAALERRFGVGGFRFVQIARDPVSLVLSAYLYHMDSDDCHNACPENRALMRQSPLAAGLKMQADAELASTLKEQHEVSKILCTDTSSLYKIMMLSDFAENYDVAVDELYTFLAGDIVSENVLADVKARAVEHDVNRWSSTRQASSEHVHTGLKKEEVVALWGNSTATQLDPERAQVNKERESYLGMIRSCGASGD